MSIKPFYTIPLLIEQPTWGGNYINEFKSIGEASLKPKKIGQSYELFDQSMVTFDRPAADQMPFAFATATSIDQPTYFHQPTNMQSIQQVIDQDPKGVLGAKVLKSHGAMMKVLIKFTQALNNSYQVHVMPGKEFSKWLAKPESWYYFEKGKATLGLRSTDPEWIAAYHQRCIEIDQKAQALSAQAQAGALTVDQARQQLREFIAQSHPQQYVNTITIEKNQTIDLSEGGIHHSWEMGPEIPNGNIVYEVQLNVMDDCCTIRAFDQGNMKDDGKVRPIAIEDYFAALNTDPSKNDPQQYSKMPTPTQDDTATVTAIFNTPYYCMSSLEFDGVYSGDETTLTDSFHHLFVQEGSVEVLVDGQAWPVQKGWSIMMPAGLKQYSLQANGKSVVLKTSV